jgi:hypothetical protein
MSHRVDGHAKLLISIVSVIFMTKKQLWVHHHGNSFHLLLLEQEN